MSNIDWFFRNPRSAPVCGEEFSQLYLLRRDIDACFGTDPNTGVTWQPVDKRTGADIHCQAIWPGTMAILAGIDMLGKFLAGNDKTRGPGKVTVADRFKAYCKRYLCLTNSDADLVYQLRNSLLHAFGLYSEVQDNQGNATATYNFILSRAEGRLVEHLKDDYYRVDAQCLRELFDQSVAKYEAELRDVSRQENQDLNNKFNAMFPKHAKPMSVFSLPRANGK
jgi:hypothetical protein